MDKSNVGCTGGCLGERLNGIQEVSGSIPLISTIKITTKSLLSVLMAGFFNIQNCTHMAYKCL